MSYTQQPCPYRLYEDSGVSFALGSIGGGLMGGLRGFWNAPSGITRRLRGGLDGMKRTAPTTGGRFACWGFAFAACDCAVAHLRGKEDPYNPIISGIITSGAFAARRGLPGMIGAAVAGGTVMTLIEGFNIVMTRFSAEDSMTKPIQ